MVIKTKKPKFSVAKITQLFSLMAQNVVDSVKGGLHYISICLSRYAVGMYHTYITQGGESC